MTAPKKNLPAGETPDEAIERIAPTPATFTATLIGTSGDADTAGLREWFRSSVLALRAIGFVVSGTLTGNAPARRDAEGNLIEAEVIHQIAADVPIPETD